MSYLAVSARGQIANMEGIVQLYKQTQHTFLERWSFHPQMACDSARVYGPMHKQARGSELYILFDRFIRVSKFFDNTGIPIFDSLQVRTCRTLILFTMFKSVFLGCVDPVNYHFF